jgi:hypothetical protein
VPVERLLEAEWSHAVRVIAEKAPIGTTLEESRSGPGDSPITAPIHLASRASLSCRGDLRSAG